MTEYAIVEAFNGDVVRQTSTLPTLAELQRLAAWLGCTVWVVELKPVEGLRAHPSGDGE